MRIAVVVALASLSLTPYAQFPSGADADKKAESVLVSNIAIYMATTFAAANEYNASYIKTRGALIATWSKQVKHFTLVADSDLSPSALKDFQASHRCRSLGQARGFGDSLNEDSESTSGGGGQSFGGPVPTALHCSVWGAQSRVLLTGCAPVWFGVTGPCCKADQAFRDFFARDLLSSGVDWLLYSDDDLFVRPLVLQRFLAAFDPSLPFVLGADKASAKFRGTPNPKANRAVLRACWREIPRCASALSLGQHYNVRAGVPHEVCTEPPPLRKPRYRRRRGPNLSTSASSSEGNSMSSIGNIFTIIDNNASVMGMELKPPTKADLVAAEARAAWKPCRSPADTTACVACLNTTIRAVEKCMGPHQAYFPGNLQPLIASRASLKRLKPALSSGVAVRRTCDEWGVTHDGAMVMLAWMHRLPYASTLADCEVYSFVKRLAGDCVPSTVALIDRVKSSADADIRDCPVEKEQQHESRTNPSSSSLFDEAWSRKHEAVGSENPWGQCLAAKDFSAARPVLLDSATRTAWFTRTQGQLLKQSRSFAAPAAEAFLDRKPESRSTHDLLVTAEASREMLTDKGSVAEESIEDGSRQRILMAKGFGFGAGPLGLTAAEDGVSRRGTSGGSNGVKGLTSSGLKSATAGAAMLIPGWKTAVDVFSMGDCRAHVPFEPAAPTPQPSAAAPNELERLNGHPRNSTIGSIGRRRKNIEAPLGPLLLLPGVQKALRELWPEKGVGELKAH